MRRLGPLIALVLLAGCSGEDPAPDPPAAAPTATATAEPGAEEPAAPEGAAAPFVGSLSVDPGDGTLMIGTGVGFFRLAPGDERAEPFEGELATPDASGAVSSNLVLRYTGPDELIASGHPQDGGSGLPEDLGLIASGDDGATWTPVSLLGKEDLHALDVRGDVVAGQPVDAARVLVSENGGRSFEERTPPAVPVDLDLDPADPRRIAITTEQGVFVSGDAGGSWRQRDVATTETHLAWSGTGALYRVDASGAVQVSKDAGESWTAAGSAGGSPTTVTVDGKGRLYAALAGGAIVRSADGGRSFSELTRLVTP